MIKPFTAARLYMGIQIIVDSASDFTQEQAANLGIKLLPLTVAFGDETFRDGIDLDHSGFYDKLIETDVFPKTSQLPPFEYEKAFREVIEAGDEVLCITLSSKLSGCYQSANIAAAEFDSGVYIVDSENVTVGERILTERALELKNTGKSAAEIKQLLDEEKKSIRLIALLDTLEYLKKGGRISATVAFAGNLLSIKPVVAVQNGEVVFLGMARGSKHGNNKLIELIKKEGGINFKKPYYLAYTGHSRAMLDKYIQDSQDLFKDKTDVLPVSTVGCSIGTHIGPGAICATFFCPAED